MSDLVTGDAAHQLKHESQWYPKRDNIKKQRVTTTVPDPKVEQEVRAVHVSLIRKYMTRPNFPRNRVCGGPRCWAPSESIRPTVENGSTCQDLNKRFCPQCSAAFYTLRLLVLVYELDLQVQWLIYRCFRLYSRMKCRTLVFPITKRISPGLATIRSYTPRDSRKSNVHCLNAVEWAATSRPGQIVKSE